MKLFKNLLIALALTFFVKNIKAQCTASYTQSVSSLSVNFTSTSSGTSPSTTYFWYLGDGSTSSLQNPSHTYAASGNYNVVLEIRDTAGGFCFDSISNYLSLSASSGCQLNASFTDSSSGSTSYFNSTVTSAFSTINYTWYFGDGSISNLQNPSHTYSTSGPFNVYLLVSDTNGCSDTAMQVIRCNLSASYSHTTIGSTVNFTSTSTGTSTGTTYSWDFGDGNSSTLQNPSHTYSSSGTYNVDLMVFDSNGCKDTAYSTITVVGSSSPCSISTSFVETITGLSVVFSSTSTGTNGTANYNWNFGDGSTGTGNTSTHTYSSQGLYSVSLTVSDSICSDSNTRLIGVSSNIFTPNGDGIDDVFPLPCQGTSATVYNTSGVLVKTLATGTTSWDGTNNLGGNEPTGLYFILCSGTSLPLPVTLVR